VALNLRDFLILENVKGLLNSNMRELFTYVCEDFLCVSTFLIQHKSRQVQSPFIQSKSMPGDEPSRPLPPLGKRPAPSCWAPCPAVKIVVDQLSSASSL